MIVMLEGKGNMIAQQDVIKSIGKGAVECQQIINVINQFQASIGKTKRELQPPPELSSELLSAIKAMCEMRLHETFRNHEHDKLSRDTMVNAIREDVIDRVLSSYPDSDRNLINDEFSKCSKDIFRDIIFNNERCDGRSHTELRPISCEINLHNPLHGSALFQRGQTQVMATVSLDSVDSALKIDPISALDM